jgi:hypothetical protein
MMFVIQFVGLGGIVIDKSSRANSGDLLESYDPEAHEGQGTAKFTGDKAKAMVFDDITDAYRLIFKVPVKRPRREDGKPNMPLRAFDLIVTPIEKVK